MVAGGLLPSDGTALLRELRAAGSNLAAAVSSASSETLKCLKNEPGSIASSPARVQDLSKSAVHRLHEFLASLSTARRSLRETLATADANGVVSVGAASTGADDTLDELWVTVQRLTVELQAVLPHLDTLALTLRHTLDEVAEAVPKASGEGSGTIMAPEEIIAYAYKLRFTTFQSLGVLPGLPPAPQLDQLHASSLVHFNAEQARFAADAEARRAEQERQKSAKAPTSAAAAVQPVALPLPFDPSQLPPIPPDWQPGDPIPLLPDLATGFAMPPLPPGWRPGDPVPLPPMLPTSIQPSPPAAASTDVEEGDLAPAAPKPEMLSFILNADLQEPEDYSSSEDETSSDM